MFTFNEFCKNKQCPNYRDMKIPAGHSISCKLVGISFGITKIPEACLHLEEIQAAKKYAKEKHNTWERLNRTERPFKTVKITTSAQHCWRDITDEDL